jgi:type I restriction enzyme S subunit
MNSAGIKAIYLTTPPDWAILPLRDVLQRVRKSANVRPDALYREIGLFSHGRGIFHKEERTGASLGKKSVYWVEPGCFVVNIVFAWEQAIGKTTTAEKDMIASHRFPLYKPKEGVLDLDYLVYYFATPQGKHLLGLASPGGAGRNRTLGQQAFMDLSIPLPPFVEQCKIVEILRSWDRAITLVQQRIEAARQRRTGLRQQLLTGDLRFLDRAMPAERFRTKFGDLPVDWELAPLQKLVKPVSRTESVQPGKEYRLLGVRLHGEGAHIHSVLSGGAIQATSLSRIEENDIVYNKMWTTKAAFAIAGPEQEGAYGTTEYPQFRARADLLRTDFLQHVFRLSRFQYDAASLCRGTTGRARLNPRDFLKLEIPLPPYEEQRQVATVLQTCDREIELLTEKHSALQCQKKGLMQQLLTGRVRVSV